MGAAFWIRCLFTIGTGILAFLTVFLQYRHERKKKSVRIPKYVALSLALTIFGALSTITIDSVSTSRANREAELQRQQDSVVQGSIRVSLAELTKLSSEVSKLNYPVDNLEVHFVVGFPLSELDTTICMDLIGTTPSYTIVDSTGEESEAFSLVDFEAFKNFNRPYLYDYALEVVFRNKYFLPTAAMFLGHGKDAGIVRYQIDHESYRTPFNIAFEHDTAYMYMRVRAHRLPDNLSPDYIPSLATLKDYTFGLEIATTKEYTTKDTSVYWPKYFLWGGVDLCFDDARFVVEFHHSEMQIMPFYAGLSTTKPYISALLMTPPLTDLENRRPTTLGTDVLRGRFVMPCVRNHRPLTDHLKVMICDEYLNGHHRDVSKP